MSNFFTELLQNFLGDKDIRKYKKNIFYYLFFRLVRKRLKHNIKVKIYNFYIWASHKKNKQSYSILRKCDFEDLQELSLIEKLSMKKNIIFFDCGANFGFYSLFVSSLSINNKIFSFEASPYTFKDLTKNITLNKFQNIECTNKAISDKSNYEIEFMESKNDWESSISNTYLDFSKTIKVQTISLDYYFKSKNIKFADYNFIIKLDVEGHEMNVIKGGLELIRKYSPLIIIEFSKFIKKEDYNLLKNFIYENDYLIYDNKYQLINLDIVIDRLNKLPKGMYGIGNNFLLKKNSNFEELVKYFNH